jgi:hypothetical protein
MGDRRERLSPSAQREATAGERRPSTTLERRTISADHSSSHPSRGVCRGGVCMSSSHLQPTQLLEAERDRLATALAQMAVGVILLEAPSRRVLLANAAAEQLLATSSLEPPVSRATATSRRCLTAASSHETHRATACE